MLFRSARDELQPGVHQVEARRDLGVVVVVLDVEGLDLAGPVGHEVVAAHVPAEGPLGTEAERALGDDVGGHFFITDWPSEVKPFYIKDHDDDTEVSTGFDLNHPRMELVSGGQREHRHEHLIEGFEQQGLDPGQFEYYTKTFKYGMPPHAAWGLGAERLLVTMLDLDNIREAVLFPRDRQRLSP